jgi:hypothetical protein
MMGAAMELRDILAGFIAARLPLGIRAKETDLQTRRGTRLETFHRSFSLSGFDMPQPAGVYVVDTEEALLEALSFPAWKRVATAIRIARNGATEYLPINPGELQDALRRDRDAQRPTGFFPGPPDARHEEAGARTQDGYRGELGAKHGSHDLSQSELWNLA